MHWTISMILVCEVAAASAQRRTPPISDCPMARCTATLWIMAIAFSGGVGAAKQAASGEGCTPGSTCTTKQVPLFNGFWSVGKQVGTLHFSSSYDGITRTVG